MAGLDYTPNNQVAPQGAPSNDYLNVRANSNDFGGQVAQANQGLGKTLEGVGNEAIQTGLQIQGVANEHAATAAEMQLAVQGGDVYNQYKSLTGFDAANSKNQAIADYMKVSDKIRASLPNPAAQRSYDQLATRRMSFTIQDMNSYAAEQQKKGYVTGKTASMNLDVDSTSRYEVASDPAQLGFAVGSIKFKIGDLFTNPEYGTYRTIPATQNKDGSISFADTPQGKAAQADYDNYVNLVIGKVYTNATKIIEAHDNVIAAGTFLSNNESKMPSATFAQLSHSLAPAIKNEQARSGADQFVDGVTQEASNPSPVIPDVSKFFPGATVTSTLRTPEHNAKVRGVPNSAHLTGQAVDFVPPAGLTIDQAKARMVSEGYNVTEALNEGNHFHLGWAPKVNSQGIPPNIARGADSYRNQAVYVGTNMPQLIDKARLMAEQKFPGDSPTQDAYVAHVTQRLGNIVSAQRSADLQDKQNIIGFIQKQGVTSEQQIMSGPPQIRDAWLRMNGNDTYAATGFRNYIAANAQGKQVVLGTDFYKYLQSSLRGETQNPADLENAIVPQKGAHSPLTNTGVDFIRGRLDPNEHSFNQAMSQYLEAQHKLYTGGSLAGAKDSESSPEFDKALLDIIPKIQAGKQRGLTAQQMFSPEINGKVNPDYISAAVSPPATSTLFARQASKTLSMVGSGSGTADYKTLEDIKKAKDAGKLTYQQAVDLGRKKGLLAPEAPKVPMDLN